jgi:hypothetical protein
MAASGAGKRKRRYIPATGRQGFKHGWPMAGVKEDCQQTAAMITRHPVDVAPMSPDRPIILEILSSSALQKDVASRMQYLRTASSQVPGVHWPTSAGHPFCFKTAVSSRLSTGHCVRNQQTGIASRPQRQPCLSGSARMPKAFCWSPLQRRPAIGLSNVDYYCGSSSWLFLTLFWLSSLRKMPNRSAFRGKTGEHCQGQTGYKPAVLLP